jgi:serine kinase of HPr protein (carbohydrate metabolism regulator)
MIRVHGSSVALAGTGVLLRGPSGAGKSDLALRLIEAGACLVADDQVELSVSDGGLIMRPPDELAGLLEVRGIGVLRFGYLENIPLSLVVDLVPAEQVERMPEAESAEMSGVRLPLLRLCPWEASAPAKVRLAVGVAGGSILCLR